MNETLFLINEEDLEKEEKAYKLLEFIEKEKRMPVSSEEYNGIKIGTFWSSIKQGNYKNVYNNILSKNYFIIEAMNKFLEKKEKRDKIEKITPEEKAHKLIEFVEKEKRIPVSTEEYNGIKIGSFWSSIKQGNNINIYNNILSKNSLINEAIDKYLERVEKLEKLESCEKENGENYKIIEKLSTEEKAHILIEFIEKEKRIPRTNDQYDNFNVGHFWNRIKQGNNKKIYDTILSKNKLIKEEMSKFLEKRMGKKENDDKSREDKENKKDKEDKKDRKRRIKDELSHEEKALKLIEFVDTEKRVPSFKEEYYDIKIGHFWNSIKQGNYKDVYKNILSKNVLIKEEMDKFLEEKEEKKEEEKDKIFPEEKALKLIEFVDREERVPSFKEEYHDIKIGHFWNSIKQGNYKKIYDIILSKNVLIKEEMNNFLEEKEDKLSTEEKALKLIEFFEKEKRPPTTKECRELKIGSFWNHTKQGINKNIYDNILSKNDLIREEMEKFLVKKEDKISPEEKAFKLIEFVEKENRIPTTFEEYCNFKIGSFWIHIKQGTSKKVYDNILSKNKLIKEEMDKFLEEKEDKLSPEEKALILIEFVEKENRIPTTKECYNLKIGSFWSHVKQGATKKVYDDILSKNDLIKEAVSNHLEKREREKNEKIEKIEKNENEKESEENKNSKKNKNSEKNKKSTFEEKALKLIEFVEKEKRLPSTYEEYANFKIGFFWNNIKHGCNKNLYTDILSKNNLIKEEMNKFLEEKEDKLSPEEKALKLIEFVEKESRMPTTYDEYVNFKIGFFWNEIKKGTNKKIYDNILSKNKLIKEEMDKFLEDKEERDKKEKLSPDKKAYKLIEFIEKEKRLPKRKEEYDGFKIGYFFDNIKQGKNEKIYKNILSQNKLIKESMYKK